MLDPRRQDKTPIIRRSALGLVAIYNMLPDALRREKSVKLSWRKPLAEYPFYAILIERFNPTQIMRRPAGRAGQPSNSEIAGQHSRHRPNTVQPPRPS